MPMEEQAANSGGGQNGVVRDLLTLAWQLIHQGKPSQALQAVTISTLYFFIFLLNIEAKREE